MRASEHDLRVMTLRQTSLSTLTFLNCRRSPRIHNGKPGTMVTAISRELGARCDTVLLFSCCWSSVSLTLLSWLTRLQVAVIQWFIPWYPQGKTSIESHLNIPGKIGWATMECPGFLVMLYMMFTVPATQGIQKLPLENWVLASLFVGVPKMCCFFTSTDQPQTIHYIYRAIIAPLFLNPSMSPIHVFVWLSAFSFQVFNGLSVGGWLAGYGPTTRQDWDGTAVYMQIGMMLFALGFAGNIYHDDELREIRRAAARKQSKKEQAQANNGSSKGVDKVYMVPENGLFRWILYPHYLCEWIEWTGFWIVGGASFIPGRNFVLAEIATMTMRALQGKQWYIEKFGQARIGNRKAVIPGLL